MQTAEEQTPQFSRKWIYFGMAAIAAFMGTLDSSIVNVALPTLSEEFKADVKVVAWVPQAYILTMTALLLVAGKLLDIWGERKQFVVGFMLFTLGSAACAFATSIHMLIFSRVFQAVGGSVLMSSNQGLIAKAFPAGQRGRILGTIGTVVSIGLATGPVLGGFLIGHLGWRSIFWINLPIGVIAIAYAMRSLANNPSTGDDFKFDWSGSVMTIAGLGAFFLGMGLGPDLGWTNPAVLILISVGLAFLVLYLFNESRVSHPILPLFLLKNRYFVQSASCAFLAFVGLTSNSILMPFYIQNVRGFSPQVLGLFMMTVPASMFLVAPPAGWISDLIGTRIPATIGLLMLSAGLFMLSGLGINSGYFEIVWHLAIIGIGMGIFASPNTNAVLSSVPRKFVGLVSGITALMRSSGITFGIAISVLLFTFFRNHTAAAVDQGEQMLFLAGLAPAFKISAAIIFVGAIVSVTRGKRPEHGES